MPSATIHVSPLGSIVVIAVPISTAATSAALVVAARAPSTFIAARCLWLVDLLSRERSPVAATIELLRHVRAAAAAIHSLECFRSIVATATAAEGLTRAGTELPPHVIVPLTFGAALHLRPGVEAR